MAGTKSTIQWLHLVAVVMSRTKYTVQWLHLVAMYRTKPSGQWLHVVVMTRIRSPIQWLHLVTMSRIKYIRFSGYTLLPCLELNIQVSGSTLCPTSMLVAPPCGHVSN